MGESSFSSERKNLGGLLIGVKEYKVPPNQRDFEWGSQLWEDFFDDLILSFNSKDIGYFLGSCIFEYNDKNNSVLVYDGQQRLTVLTLLWAVIRDLLWKMRKYEASLTIQKNYIVEKTEKGRKTTKLTLNLRNEDFFAECIKKTLEEGEERKDFEEYEHAYGKLNESDKLIKECYNYFEERFIDEFKKRNIGTDKEKTDFLTDVSEYLRDHFVLVIIKVENEDEAFMVYETVNQRRTDLSVADLFKNFLIGRAKKIGEDKGKVVDDWKEIVDILEDKTKPFLKHYWNSKFEAITERRLFKELKNYILNEKISVLTFLNELKEEATIYSALLNPKDSLWKDKKIIELLKDFNVLDAKQCLPLLLASYKKFTLATEFKNLLNSIINFTFRYSTICNKHNNILEGKYNDMAISIRGEKTINSKGEKIIKITTTKEAFKKLEQIYPSKTEFELSFSDKAIKDEKLARYILSKIDNAKSDYGDIITKYEDYTLEHIFPKKPKDGWGDFLKLSKDEIDRLRIMIGNLTLLEQKMNSSDARNYAFAKKQKDAYSKSELWINESLKTNKKWTKESIIERQKELSKIVDTIWKIDF